jgi:hypothetical protein
MPSHWFSSDPCRVWPASALITLVQLMPSALSSRTSARASTSPVSSSDENETRDPASECMLTASGSHINRHPISGTPYDFEPPFNISTCLRIGSNAAVNAAVVSLPMAALSLTAAATLSVISLR